MSEIFKKRSGTVDFGREYDIFIPAYFAIILYNNENVADFKLRCNDPKFGYFDDVVIDVWTKNQEQLCFAFKLKHSNNNRKISFRNLENQRGDFNLMKYFREVPKDRNYHVILYTNREFLDPKKDDKIKMTKNVHSFAKLFDASKSATTYKFESMGMSAGEDEEFLERFSAFSQQPGVEDVRHLILNILKYEEQFLKYIEFFRKWYQDDVGQILDKKILNIQLIDIFLSSFILNDYQLSDYKTENLKLFDKSLREFDVTVIDETKENFIGKMKKSCVFKEHEEMLLLGKRYRIVDRNIKELEEDEVSKIYNYLVKELIIIDFNEISEKLIYQVLELTKMKNNIKFVLLGHGVDSERIPHLRIFQNLKDLSRINNSLFEEIISKCTLSLQNRPSILLSKLIEDFEEIVECITPKEIYQMLIGTYNIGEDEEKLPLYYIPRTVSTVVLDFEMIINHCINSKDLVIIDFKNKSEHFEDVISKYQVAVGKIDDLKGPMASTATILSITEEESSKLSEIINENLDRPIHYMRLVNEEDFLLVKSTRNTLPTKKISVEEGKIHCIFNDSVNVLCAQPGMGKSTLFRHLKNSYDSKFWTLMVDLKAYNSYLKQKHEVDDILRLFLNVEQFEDASVRKIVTLFLRQRKVVLFLDGLDEIINECVDNVLYYIQELASMGFRIWLSSRQNLQKKIEDYLKVFAVEINELDNQEQKRYIDERLGDHYEEEEIREIFNKIFGNAGIINTSQVLGVPLQLYIITQVFLDNKSNYTIIKNENFVLTKLYKIFFEGRFKYSTDKVEGKNVHLNVAELDDHLEKYEIPALQSLFDDDVFEKLDLDLRRTKRFLGKIQKESDLLGTIVRLNNEHKAIFLDRSFAEYFACRFLYNNFSKARLLKEHLFAERYRNLLLMLNMMLAENKPSHLRVLYKNCDDLVEDETLDEGGRNLLHIAACVATRHPRSLEKGFEGETSDCKSVVRSVLHVDPFQKDTLFEYSALDYALACGALYVVEEILKHHSKPSDLREIVQKHCDYHYILFYSLKLDYRHLLAGLSANEILSINLIKHNLIDAYLKEKFGEVLKQVPECYTDIVKRRLQEQLFSYEIPALRCLLDDQIFRSLNLDLRRTKSFLKKVKNDGDLLGIIEEIKDDEVIFKHQIYADYFAGIFLCYNYDKAQVLARQLFSEKYKTLLHIVNSILIDKNSLHWAIIFKNVDFIRKHMDQDRNLDSGGRNPLHIASFIGERYPDLESPCYGIEDQNVKSESNENRELFRMLIRRRFDPLETDKFMKWTPIEYALANGNLFLIEEILKECHKLSECGSSTNDDFSYKYGHMTDAIEKYYKEAVIVYYSSRFGLKNLFSVMVKKDPNLINTTNSDGNSFLHLAVKTKNRPMFDMLLENGIDINRRNNEGETVLHYAALEQDLAAVCRLIKHKIDVNLPNQTRETALHYAVEKPSFDIAYTLLSESANINATNFEHETPLHYALRAGNFKVAKLLLYEKCDIKESTNLETPLHYAVKWGNNMCGEDDSGQDIAENKFDVIKLLIERGININASNLNGETVLHFAVRNGDFDVVRLLIEHGANINETTHFGESPLHYAVLSGNYDVVKLLVDKEVSIDGSTYFRETPLHYAILSGNYDVVKLLVDKEVSINDSTYFGETPLHYAVIRGNYDVIKLLIDKVASIDDVTYYGETPLHYAAASGNYDAVKLLFEKGVDINAESDYEETPLHYAVESGKLDVVKFLLDHRVDVTCFNNRGETPLHYVVKRGDPKLFNLLIEYGADVNLTDEDGKTVLDYIHASNDEMSGAVFRRKRLKENLLRPFYKDRLLKETFFKTLDFLPLTDEFPIRVLLTSQKDIRRVRRQWQEENRDELKRIIEKEKEKGKATKRRSNEFDQLKEEGKRLERRSEKLIKKFELWAPSQTYTSTKEKKYSVPDSQKPTSAFPELKKTEWKQND